jgi:hypothetical protein
MEIAVTTKLNPANVNLAALNQTKITSDNCIQIKDLSIGYQPNQMPAFGDFITTSIDKYGQYGYVKFYNESYQPSITSYYNYLVDLGRSVPLWYRYPLKTLYYNTSTKYEYVRINNMLPETYYDLISSASNRIICKNTVRALYSGTDLPDGMIVLDISKQRIKFRTNNNYNGRDINVSFYTIDPSIYVYDKNNVAPNKELIRLVVEKVETTPDGTNTDANDFFSTLTAQNERYLNHLYYVELYTNLETTNNTHYVEYKTYDGDQEKQRTEIINQVPIYKAVPSAPRINEFTVDPATYAISMSVEGDIPVFLKMPNRNSKVGIFEPVDIPITKPWYLRIYNDGYYDDSRVYYPYEAQSSLIENVQEKPVRTSKTTIRTIQRPIHVVRNSQNAIQNISIMVRGSDVSSYITEVDEANGIIYIKETIPFDPIDVQLYYQRDMQYGEYRYLNLNPSMYFTNTSEIMTKNFVIFMLPQGEVVSGMNRSIFHFDLYKVPYIHDPMDPTKIDSARAIAYLNDPTTDLVAMFPGFILPADPVWHPIMLGIVSVTNPYTAKSLPMYDIRYRGGGIRVVQDENEYMDGTKMNLLDISYWDGIPLNLENLADVTIPISVRDTLANKFRYYDTATIRQLRKDPTFDVYTNVDIYINEVIAKYLRAGCSYQLRYK